MVTDCEIDLRPGGIFRTTMEGPEGHVSPSTGCYLEVIGNERLVFTDGLLPGYRPAANPFMTAILQLETVEGGKTRYTAIARHRDEESRPSRRLSRCLTASHLPQTSWRDALVFVGSALLYRFWSIWLRTAWQPPKF